LVDAEHDWRDCKLRLTGVGHTSFWSPQPRGWHGSSRRAQFGFKRIIRAPPQGQLGLRHPKGLTHLQSLTGGLIQACHSPIRGNPYIGPKHWTPATDCGCPALHPNMPNQSRAPPQRIVAAQDPSSTYQARATSPHNGLWLLETPLQRTRTSDLTITADGWLPIHHENHPLRLLHRIPKGSAIRQCFIIPCIPSIWAKQKFEPDQADTTHRHSS